MEEKIVLREEYIKLGKVKVNGEKILDILLVKVEKVVASSTAPNNNTVPKTEVEISPVVVRYTPVTDNMTNKYWIALIFSLKNKALNIKPKIGIKPIIIPAKEELVNWIPYVSTIK